ncbi:Stress response protein nst1, partial [Coemansia nantahalensis]
MAAITAKLHETFQSQLLTIMAEHGYDSMNCSMQDIADVLFSLGLLSSPTDDVADALRRHLQADLCRFMYSRLQEVTHGTVQGRMAQILTDPEAYARQCGADQHGETLEYDPDDPGELDDGSGPQRHSFIRLFRGEMDAQFEAGCDEDGPPSLPPTEPEWAIALARRLLPAHVQTVDSLLAGGAEGSEGTDKQQKTKKKRRRPKKKGKAKADDCDEDDDMGLDASSDNITEPGLVREFWLSLSETERQALVVVEKEVVLARVRDQQNFSCGCHVCTRKREAIERELDSLYDNYYDVLKRNARKANLRLWVASARKHAQSMILRLVEALTDMVVDKLDTQPEAATRKRVQQVVIRCLEQSPDAKVLFGPELHKLTGPESALRP